jgi:hypothetical protein
MVERFRAKTNKLEVGQTTTEVAAILMEPPFTEQQTCGGANGIETWSCRIWIYPVPQHETLRLYFARCNESAWCLNNWRWTP